jgi:hypothetical protein
VIDELKLSNDSLPPLRKINTFLSFIFYFANVPAADRPIELE